MPTLPALRRRRTLVVVVLTAAALAVAAFAEQRAVGRAIGQLQTVRAPSWPPIVIAIAAICLGYWCAAVALRAAAGRDLPMGRTVLVQLAGAAANRVTPGGVGSVAVNGRYLTCQGCSVGRSAAAVSLLSAAHATVVVAGIMVAAPSVGLPYTHFLDHPGAVTVLLLVAAAAVIALLGWTAAKLARSAMARGGRFATLVRDVIAGFAEAVRDPRRLAVLVGSVAVGRTCSLVALIAATHAFASDVPVWRVAVVFLVGVPAAEAIPTPGGLGTVDAMLIAGLSATAGVTVPAVVAAVVLFRLMTYWLPIVPGALASGVLRRRVAL